MINEQGLKIDTTDSVAGGSTIDWKRIGYQGLRYWYLIALSLSISLATAFYNNRYTLRIYPVVGSIIIREREETTGAELLYKNALIDQYRNYLNEPYIIRSYPLVESVVKELNMDVVVSQEGYVRTSELYHVLPVIPRLIRGSSPVNPGKFTFSMVDDNTVRIQKAGSAPTKPQDFQIGSPVLIDNNQLIFDRVEGIPLKGFQNHTYLMSVRLASQVAAEYVGKLDISWAEEGAGVINIKLVGPIPQKNIDFINGLVSNYQRLDLEKKNQTANKTVEFIKGQLVKIADSLRLFEGQLQRFKKDNKTSGDLDMEAQRAIINIEGLGQQRAELMMKEQYYVYLDHYIRESKRLDQVVLPSSLGVSDPVIGSLLGKIIDLQLELKLYLDMEKVTNPLITNKLNRLEGLKNEILESIQSLRATDKIKLGFLNRQIDLIEKQISYLPLAERELVSIKRNYSLLENLYVFLMQKMSEAEISKASSASDILLVNPPVLSGGSITPKISQNYSIAIVLGLGIPLLVLLLVEIFNTKVQSKEDIDRTTAIPFIGGIGHKKAVNNSEVLSSPKSAIAESFRALRSNLNYFINTKNRPVFLISSSISGEGKTFTSINLASIFALSGKRTLIVGADMRKPKIYQDLHLSNEHGLSTYLSGMDDFDRVIQHTSNEFLDLASGGPVPPNPSELLLNSRMEAFIMEARRRYDFVIIDTPPMAIVTDAFVLAAFADHTLFIVRQNYTPKSLIKTANEFYVSGKLKNMSIVLNDIYKSGPGYGYGYGYDYYYSYGFGKGYGAKKNGYGYYTEE